MPEVSHPIRPPLRAWHSPGWRRLLARNGWNTEKYVAVKIRPCREWATLDARWREASARDDWSFFYGQWVLVDADRLPALVEAVGEGVKLLQVRTAGRVASRVCRTVL